MLQLVRANNGADNKAHLAFIKNGLTLFGMGYYPGASQSAFGLVPSFGTMATNTGLWMLTNGYVGIGTTNPSYALHVVGAIYATGDINAFSDQRYKQNIVRLECSLDKILHLNGYSYTRNDYRPGERQLGLLAQEVQTVLPEAVQYDSVNDKYSVNYSCLMAPVVESIKDLQNQILEQGKTIQMLLDRLGPQ